MSFTFRMVFEGVCAFVPEGEGFFKRKKGSPADSDDPKHWEPGNVEGLTVLLPDLRTPDLATWKFLKNNHFRAAHYPLLGCRLDQVQRGTTRRIDLIARELDAGHEKAILLLRKEQVRLRTTPSVTQGFSFAGDIGMDEAPNPGKPSELQSIWWLPRLLEIEPQHSKPRPNLDPKIQGIFPEELVARVEISRGYFSTFGFNGGAAGKPPIWRFAPPEDANTPGKWNKSIANQLALEIYDVGESVTLELKRLASDVHTETLVLAPAPGLANPVVEVHIKNIELEDLLDKDDRDEGTFLDPDFQSFYHAICECKKGEIKDLRVPNNSGLNRPLGPTERPCAPTATEPFKR